LSITVNWNSFDEWDILKNWLFWLNLAIFYRP
jgi:hypothetical protein